MGWKAENYFFEIKQTLSSICLQYLSSELISTNFINQNNIINK